MENLLLMHQGSSKMKERARQSVYWPGMNADIQRITKSCKPCQKNLPSLPKEPLQQRPRPSRAFQELHADFCYFGGKYFLVMVDGHSGWATIDYLGNNARTHELVRIVRRRFSEKAVPEVFWSDGGPQFTSFAFKEFLKRWGVTHRMSSPHYAQSNGMAESGVKEMKKLIRGSWLEESNTPDWDKISKGLLIYYNTPRYDGLTPALRVFGHSIRDTIPAHKRFFSKIWKREMTELEKISEEVRKKAKDYYDQSSHILEKIGNGRKVIIQNPHTKKWEKQGIVVETNGRDLLIRTDGGRVWRRNRRFVRPYPDRWDEPDHETDKYLEVVRTPAAGTENPTIRRSERSRVPPEKLVLCPQKKFYTYERGDVM